MWYSSEVVVSLCDRPRHMYIRQSVYVKEDKLSLISLRTYEG